MSADQTNFNDATFDSTVILLQPVMAIQGFSGHDLTTLMLTSELNKSPDHNVKAYGSGTGFNTGLSHCFYSKLQDQFDHIYEKHDGQPLDLIGHSLGGIMALLLAYDNADRVDSVMTLASPFEIMFGPKGRNLHILPMNKKDRALYDRLKAHIQDAPPAGVDVTSVYSPNGDWVVRGEGGRNPWDGHENAENIPVDKVGHFEMLFNSRILDLIARPHAPHITQPNHSGDPEATPVVV